MPKPTTDPSTWLERHGDSLFRFALRRLGDAARAEDAVQEALLAALQARERFVGESSELTWLTGILRHKVLDQLRTQQRDRQRHVGTDDEDALERLRFGSDGGWTRPPPAWTRPDRALQQDEFLDGLERCIDGLPERMGRAFALREFEGLSGAQVREVLGVSESNLWAMLSRARMRLRECMDRYWTGTGS